MSLAVGVQAGPQSCFEEGGLVTKAAGSIEAAVDDRDCATSAEGKEIQAA